MTPDDGWVDVPLTGTPKKDEWVDVPLRSGNKSLKSDVTSEGSDWGDQEKPQPTFPPRKPRVDPDAEILAKYGIGVNGGPSWSDIRGASSVLPFFQKGSVLGNASNTRVGRKLTGLMDLPVGVFQSFSHLIGKGEDADALVRLREKVIQENRDDSDKSASVVGIDPSNAIGGFTEGLADQRGASRSQDIGGVDPLRVAGGLAVPIPGLGAAKGFTGLVKAAGMGGALGALQPNPNVQYDPNGGSDYWGQAASDAIKGASINSLLHGVTQGVGRLIQGRNVTPAPANVNELGADIERSLPGRVQADIQDLSAVNGPRSGAAASIAQEYQNVGADPTKQLQASAKAKFLKEQVANDEIFAARDKAAGNTDVPVPRTVAAIDDAIAQLERDRFPGQEVTISKLQKFKDNLLGKQQTTSPVLDPYGNPIPTQAPPQTNNFQDLSRTRSSVKRDVASMYTSDPTGRLGSAEAARIADALSEDMSAALRLKGGNAQALDEAARAQYTAFKKKWGDDTLNKELMNSTKPDELLAKFTRAGEDRAANAKDALTPVGHEAVQSMILDKLLEESGGDPGKFLTLLKPMKGAVSVFFDGPNKAKMDGLTKIMQTAQSVGNVGAPAIGATGGAILGGPIGAVAGAVAGAPFVHYGSQSVAQKVSSMAKWLLSTPTGQKYLLRASTLKPQSAELQQLLAAIEQESALASGQMSAPPQGQEPQ